ncbi:MAG TPA: hypothetical protein VM733_02310 [Thermoanaerobaculia bacterium]|nr:hypothetical protein [Thermoanaerobaculia bacterium]
MRLVDSATRMLIDTLLPHCDFYERHSIVVRATPERAWDAILNARLGESRITRSLLAMRGIRAGGPTFSIAGTNPPWEIVRGIEGPFWKPTCKPYAPDFAAPVPPDVARGAWNFFVERLVGENDDARVRITTETRVLCGENAKKKFGVYWFFIRAGSGIIRRMMLRAIKREAESVSS